MAPLTHPARAALEQYNREHPGIWQHVDKARAERNWPPQVFLPQQRAGKILARLGPRMAHQGATPAEQAMWLAMFAAWRTTQGIYRFDPDIYSALMATPLTGEIPVVTLSRLPEWCVYIETPGKKWWYGGAVTEQQGLWAWLDWHERLPTPLMLALGLHTEPWPIFAHLPLGSTVEQSLTEVQGTMSSTRPGSQVTAPLSPEKVRYLVQVLGPLLSLVLYLCSEGADIGDGTRMPQNPQPRRSKGLERISPPHAPATWDVGVRMGAMLRRARAAQDAQATPDEAAGRRTVRPHVRRAHWAHRWTGPRTGERQSVLRWIHPVLVNVGSLDELPSVIWPVKKPPEEEDED